MQVFDEPHRVVWPAKRVETFEPRGEQALALLPQACRRLDRSDHSRERVPNHFCPAPGKPADHVVGLADASHQLADGLEGRQQVRPQASAQHDGAGRGRMFTELFDQTRLADTGWSDDDDPATPVPDLAAQLLELSLASHDWRAQAAECALTRTLRIDPGDAEGKHAVRLPLQVERADRLQFDRVRHRKRGQLTDDDRPGLGRGLKPCRHVHRVAGDRAAVGGRLAVDGFAAVHADADPQHFLFETEAGADSRDCSDEREAGANRSLRIVVTDARRAEDRHRRVPDKLFQLAPVPVDRLAHRVEVRVLHERDVFGVETLRERREADEIGEEDGDYAPLHGSCRHSGESTTLR